MNTLEDRKKSEEAKAAHKAVLRFKAEARCNKLFGLWAAEQMGHADPDAYAVEVIAAVYGGPGRKTAFEKVRDDLHVAGKPIPENELRVRMNAFMDLAEEQVQAEN
jgi:hypothetical protein